MPQTETLYKPTREDRFTFGLWTWRNRGRDPFGDSVREPAELASDLSKLAACGAYGINLHDNDFFPFDASAAKRRKLMGQLKGMVADNGLVTQMFTTNLFFHPVFRDGAFTSNDRRVRNFALQKTVCAIDMAVEAGASEFVFWGGREGTEVEAAKDPLGALKHYRDALNWLCEYAMRNQYKLAFALEPKVNEPRANIFLPTVGHMLAFINTLSHPQMVGVNPEYAHETMAGLNFYHGVAQALDAQKLFHVDLNDQLPGRFDQDLAFGSESLKPHFYLVQLLEEHEYRGPLHFDAHPLRTEGQQGVWDFVRRCMRNYLILKEKARQFRNDEEIMGLLRELRALEDNDEDFGVGGQFTPEAAARLKGHSFDLDAMSREELRYEQLDQLVVELLMGVR